MKRRYQGDSRTQNEFCTCIFTKISLDLLKHIFNFLLYLKHDFSWLKTIDSLSLLKDLKHVCKKMNNMVNYNEFGMLMSIRHTEPLNDNNIYRSSDNINTCLRQLRHISCIELNQNSLSTLSLCEIRNIQSLKIIIDFEFFEATTINLGFLMNVDSLEIVFFGCNRKTNRKTLSLILPVVVNSFCFHRELFKDEKIIEDEKNDIIIAKITGGLGMISIQLGFVTGDSCMWREFFESIASSLRILLIDVEIPMELLSILKNVTTFKTWIHNDFIVDIRCFPELQHLCVMENFASTQVFKLHAHSNLTFLHIECENLKVKNWSKFKNVKLIQGRDCKECPMWTLY